MDPYTTILLDSLSPSYIPSNLVKSDLHCAFAKNGFLTSKISIFRISDIVKGNEEKARPCGLIEWESKDKDCSHLNYVQFHN
jgi:hypothetical protein